MNRNSISTCNALSEDVYKYRARHISSAYTTSSVCVWCLHVHSTANKKAKKKPSLNHVGVNCYMAQLPFEMHL